MTERSRLVAYLRVSSREQAEHGLGLEVQEQTIRKWARAEGHRIVTVATDAGVSGSNGLDARDGLPEAFATVKDGRAEGLVVARLDRLARDLIVQETLLAELGRLGAAVFTTSPAEQEFLEDDPADPSRKLIRQLLGAVAEYERSVTVLRLKAGRRRKAERGEYYGAPPPLGWRVMAGELVPDPDEQVTVRRIHELRGQGVSLRDIATALEAEGVPNKQGGSRWHISTIARAARRAAVR
ncbi:MAG: recombinase family protein [Actinomycetota bacterium]